jgi:hypothetical protein
VVLYGEATRQRSWHGLEIVNQPDAVPPSDFAPEDMVTWWAYHHQQPVVISCVATETRFPRMMARLKQYAQFIAATRGRKADCLARRDQTCCSISSILRRCAGR